MLYGKSKQYNNRDNIFCTNGHMSGSMTCWRPVSVASNTVTCAHWSENPRLQRIRHFERSKISENLAWVQMWGAAVDGWLSCQRFIVHRAPLSTIPCQAMSLDASNSEQLSLPGGRSTRTVSERFPQGQTSRDAGRRACCTACAPLRVSPRGVEQHNCL